MKIKRFIISALIYAGVSLLLLGRVSPGEGFYQSWDTSGYLAIYLLISVLYFSNVSLLPGLKGSGVIPAGILSSVVFSLGVMLIRLNGVLLEIAPSVKIQKVYFQIILLSFICLTVILSIRNLFAAVSAARGKDVILRRSFYTSFHYIALVPYAAYEIAKAGNHKYYFLLSVSLVISAVITLFLRNERVREGLRKSALYLWDAKKFLILIFVLALAARVMFAFQLTRNLPEGFMEGPDTQEINDEAVSLSKTWDILDGKPVFLNQKGSAVIFYAAIYKMLGDNPLYGRLADALLGALCVLMAFYIADKLFGQTAAKIAALLGVGYGYLIQYGVYIGTESIGLFSLMLFVCGIIAAGESRGIKTYALTAVSGLSLAVCVMARSEYYYAIVPSLIWAIWSLRKQKAGIVSFMTGFGILALIWSWRNLIAFGDFAMSQLVTAAFKDEWLARLWQYETQKFAEAGIVVASVKDMFGQVIVNPAIALKILTPHFLKGFYSFWDYNVFFTPAFIFLEPKNSCYNMTLCFYLYMFMVLGFIVKSNRKSAAVFLVLIIIFKTVSYIFTTTPTFYENGQITALFKDWYRFTIIPFTHIFMGAGIAWFIAKIRKVTS